MTTLLFENEYARLELEQTHHMMLFTWKKYTPSNFYKDIIIKYLDFLVSLRIGRILSDCRMLPVIGSEDSTWSAEMIKKYYPQLVPGHRTAVVLSDNQFTRLSIKLILKDVDNNIESFEENESVRYFKEMDAAARWLLS